MYEFNALDTKNRIVEWIKEYFSQNAGQDTKAVIGISGGKDSSVAAALCAEALGAERVLGVMMPQGIQPDIKYSLKLIDFLGIPSVTVNIGGAADALFAAMPFGLSEQARINTPARIRMSVLYAAAACTDGGGRIVNTCNLSEDYVGYSTKFGDSAGDFSPLADLTATEVISIGDAMGLPYELTHKTPTDGLCGKTDEDNLGFSYELLDKYIRGVTNLDEDTELRDRIERMHRRNLHKLLPMPKFGEYLPN